MVFHVKYKPLPTGLKLTDLEFQLSHDSMAFVVRLEATIPTDRQHGGAVVKLRALPGKLKEIEKFTYLTAKNVRTVALDHTVVATVKMYPPTLGKEWWPFYPTITSPVGIDMSVYDTAAARSMDGVLLYLYNHTDLQPAEARAVAEHKRNPGVNQHRYPHLTSRSATRSAVGENQPSINPATGQDSHLM